MIRGLSPCCHCSHRFSGCCCCCRAPSATRAGRASTPCTTCRRRRPSSRRPSASPSASSRSPPGRPCSRRRRWRAARRVRGGRGLRYEAAAAWRGGGCAHNRLVGGGEPGGRRARGEEQHAGEQRECLRGGDGVSVAALGRSGTRAAGSASSARAARPHLTTANERANDGPAYDHREAATGDSGPAGGRWTSGWPPASCGRTLARGRRMWRRALVA